MNGWNEVMKKRGEKKLRGNMRAESNRVMMNVLLNLQSPKMSTRFFSDASKAMRPPPRNKFLLCQIEARPTSSIHGKAQFLISGVDTQQARRAIAMMSQRLLTDTQQARQAIAMMSQNLVTTPEKKNRGFLTQALTHANGGPEPRAPKNKRGV